ncbi:MAG: hypothetical protein H0U74_09825 [Bradymonadaceae bacterium]|nr:hypothetical protein [Lujinxingiaceae bacterium]
MQDKDRAQLGAELLKSLVQTAPTSNESLSVRAFGQADAQNVRFFLYQDVLEELAFASAYRDEPCFAVLLGHFAMDELGAFIEVTGFDGLEYRDEVGEMYRPLRATLEQTMRELSRGETGSGRHIVGLFVGLPGCEAALDAEIARVHLSLFNMPYQMAVVVDPKARKLGVYARAPRAKFFDAPFFVVRANAAPKSEAVAKPSKAEVLSESAPAQVHENVTS